MPKIKITKKDVIWSYIAQFFSIASGLMTLPLILKLLSPDEIGMNYLMLTIGSLVALFDFGFAPQFGRNITYVFSGAQELKKEGIDNQERNGTVNYRLLATMISVAKSVYRILAFIVLFVLLTGGTFYIYQITSGFVSIKNSFTIWVVYSASVFFNLYYTYYTSLLTGKGLIMESRMTMLVSRIAYILLTFLLLLLGFGLLGVAIANLIAPFFSRYFAYRCFFTKDLKKSLSGYQISNREKWELFKIIWYNAKKLGLVFVGSYAISKFSMFLAGLYLSLETVASYGLMIQLMSIITVVSVTLFSISEPHFASLRIEGNLKKLIKDFAFTMNIYYTLFVVGCCFLIIVAPILLKWIGANATLPATNVILLYSIITLLENNHSNFATFIVTENKIPFVESSLCIGFCIAFGSFLVLHYSAFGLLGLVLVQGCCQLVYANWKWPYVVCREFNISFSSFVMMGMKESISRFKSYYGR